MALMRLLLVAILATSLLAGCSTPPQESTTSTSPSQVPSGEKMTFATQNLPVVHQGHGLYEPTIDVSSSGVLYVSAHSTGVDANSGIPAYFSKDDGKTWASLPVAATVGIPADRQGGGPPPSDEIFIVAADDGSAWGVDVTLGSYPVHGWCDNGARNCYYNPNGYDRAATTCAPSSLNDRPWAAVANGTLLMVNNPGGGPVQIGVLKVPPAEPLGVSNPVTGPKWNPCAGNGNGGIPGIPDMRRDLFFAVPQVQGSDVVVVTGHASDISKVEQHKVMPYHNDAASAVMDSGQAAFDAAGTLFVADMNNNGTQGGFEIAASADDGHNFTVQRFAEKAPVSSLYIDGNRNGPGLLVNWGVVNGTATDWFFGHLFFEGGHIVLRDVNLAIAGGPVASRHVQGAALGPDGRAYMVMSTVSGNDDQAMAQAIGTKPLSVVVQIGGAKMPVTSPAANPA